MRGHSEFGFLKILLCICELTSGFNNRTVPDSRLVQPNEHEDKLSHALDCAADVPAWLFFYIFVSDKSVKSKPAAPPWPQIKADAFSLC